MAGMKDQYLSQEDSKAYLEPLKEDCLESFWEAWGWVRTWMQTDLLSGVILNTSSVAGIVSDAFGYFAFPRLAARSDTRSRTIGRSRLAVVKEAIILRFKKLTPDLHSMNIPTDQQQNLSHNQAELVSGRKLTTVTLGYTPNSLGTDVTGIYFTCPNGATKNRWVWPIYQAEDGQFAMLGADNPTSNGDFSKVLKWD